MIVIAADEHHHQNERHCYVTVQNSQFKPSFLDIQMSNIADSNKIIAKQKKRISKRSDFGSNENVFNIYKEMIYNVNDPCVALRNVKRLLVLCDLNLNYII